MTFFFIFRRDKLKEMPEYLELFMWCDSIYVQWGRDGYGNLRKHKFEKMTKYMEMNRLIKKFKEQ